VGGKGGCGEKDKGGRVGVGGGGEREGDGRENAGRLERGR